MFQLWRTTEEKMREAIHITPIKAHHHSRLNSTMNEEIKEYSFHKPEELEYDE